MVNLKYPSAIKGKASMAWLGMFAFGFAPMFFFWEGIFTQEMNNGVCRRNLISEDQYWFTWMTMNHQMSVLGRELLNQHPNNQYTRLDQRRLKLDDLRSFTKGNCGYL